MSPPLPLKFDNWHSWLTEALINRRLEYCSLLGVIVNFAKAEEGRILLLLLLALSLESENMSGADVGA